MFSLRSSLTWLLTVLPYLVEIRNPCDHGGSLLSQRNLENFRAAMTLRCESESSPSAEKRASSDLDQLK